MVWSDLSLGDPEPFKSEVNREVGKAVSALTGKTVDFKKPDIIALLTRDQYRWDPGKLNLLLREIPEVRAGYPADPLELPGLQRGRAREKCNYTGKQYMDSVEELIGLPVIELFDAEDAVLHGAGQGRYRRPLRGNLCRLSLKLSPRKSARRILPHLKRRSTGPRKDGSRLPFRTGATVRTWKPLNQAKRIKNTGSWSRLRGIYLRKNSQMP